MKTNDKNREEKLKLYFENQIDPDFLIVCLRRVLSNFPEDNAQFVSASELRQEVEGNYETLDFELCRLIVGTFISDTLLLTEGEKKRLISTEAYKADLVKRALRDIKLRPLIAANIRKWEPLNCPPYSTFPLNRLLLANTCYYNNTDRIDSSLEPLFIAYYNHLTATLTLIGDGMLGEAYQLLRGLIEIYTRIYFLTKSDVAFEKYNAYRKLEARKNKFHEPLPESFEEEYKNKRMSGTKLGYLHFGWLDYFDDYVAANPKNPYSVCSMLHYISGKTPGKEMLFGMLENIYTTGHSYVHGNLSGSSLAESYLFFEVMCALSITAISVQTIYCEKRRCDGFEFNGVPIFQELVKEYENLIGRLLVYDWKSYFETIAKENNISVE